MGTVLIRSVVRNFSRPTGGSVNLTVKPYWPMKMLYEYVSARPQSVVTYYTEMPPQYFDSSPERQTKD